MALVFVIEGLLYAIAPGAMQDMAQKASQMPAAALRRYGLMAACIGVAAVALIRA
nr:DUF2065 domain-containing protein [Niveispirillum sp. BGYR6]